MRKVFGFLGLVLLQSLLSATVTASEGIPTGVIGLTLDDPKPNGCMTCHQLVEIKGETHDRRIIAKPSVQAVEAHAEEADFANIKTIPGDEEQGCIACHEDFGDLMHDKHFGNTANNHYVSKYFAKVGCLGCHAFEKDEEFGLSIISKQGNVNWTIEDFKKKIAESKK